MPFAPREESLLRLRLAMTGREAAVFPACSKPFAEKKAARLPALCAPRPYFAPVKKAHPRRPPKRIVGRRELVDFPQFQLRGVEAKVDTGAFTSAIHCSDIHVGTLPDGRPLLRVLLLDDEHPAFHGQPLQFEEFSLRDIRSSNGEVQERYVIQAVIRLFGEDFNTEFSLSDRSDMKYPVLIGRQVLRRARLVVDVARRNLSYKSQHLPIPE
jgi:hypothetical protein